MTDEDVVLPAEQQTPLDGLDLPSLDDLLWQDAVCNDFGVPSVSSGASEHQSGACQKEGCEGCAQSHSARDPPAGPVLIIPWSSQQKEDPQQQQQDDAQHGEEALGTPPQTDRPPKASLQQEPSSSRDSNPTHLSPQSSCDLPDSGGHKRRRAEDSSPERAGRASSSEGKSACTAAAAPQQVGESMHASHHPAKQSEAVRKEGCDGFGAYSCSVVRQRDGIAGWAERAGGQSGQRGAGQRGAGQRGAGGGAQAAGAHAAQPRERAAVARAQEAAAGRAGAAQRRAAGAQLAPVGCAALLCAPPRGVPRFRPGRCGPSSVLLPGAQPLLLAICHHGEAK